MVVKMDLARRVEQTTVDGAVVLKFHGRVNGKEARIEIGREHLSDEGGPQVTSVRSTPGRKARAAMTPKQRVLKKYPKAYLWRWRSTKFYGVELSNLDQRTLGQGTSPKAAWINAARNL